MKKTIILAMFAALCTLTAGCADDFKTVLNDKYYEDDTPSREPDITEQTLTLGSYNLWISSKGTGDYLWTNRRTVLAQSIVKNKWDIFGFQEANGTIQNELPTLVGRESLHALVREVVALKVGTWLHLARHLALRRMPETAIPRR